ncbi:hypothetical protein DCC39_15280 [Pueribacillus theae]|uniref:Uncharacterized protein n=1 Tax=Pueribacillus theae TaxID=2171751 RepID=A0A2U1JSG8_9BACI|nr:hypothetical protein [Pueribacillus theae]PWA08147.1 hypothetical protein DCC39_15280 [Pueribacillus theae]
MSDDVLTILAEKFQSGENGKEVDGLTLIIDGKVKDIFEIIKSKQGIEDNTEVFKQIVVGGINQIIRNE